MSIASDLIKARRVLSNPDRWAKGAFAYTKDGGLLEGFKRGACSFCALGAIQKVTKQKESRAEEFLDGIRCSNLEPAYRGIVPFNDSPETTHEEILMVFDLAILMAKDEEAELAARLKEQSC